MNKLNKTFVFILLMFGAMAFITACGGGDDHGHDHDNDHADHEHVDVDEGHDEAHHDDDADAKEAAYMCPMKCEGEKTYAEAGTCPKCKMDLELIADASTTQGEGHDEDGENHDGEEILHDHDGDGHADHD